MLLNWTVLYTELTAAARFRRKPMADPLEEPEWQAILSLMERFQNIGKAVDYASIRVFEAFRRFTCVLKRLRAPVRP
jgi:hypothetical protein